MTDRVCRTLSVRSRGKNVGLAETDTHAHTHTHLHLHSSARAVRWREREVYRLNRFAHLVLQRQLIIHRKTGSAANCLFFSLLLAAACTRRRRRLVDEPLGNLRIYFPSPSLSLYSFLSLSLSLSLSLRFACDHLVGGRERRTETTPTHVLTDVSIGCARPFCPLSLAPRYNEAHEP